MKAINDIKDSLAVRKLANKMNADLTKIAKVFGDNENVEGKIFVHYSGYSIAQFDEALTRVLKYERWQHNVIIRSNFSVSLILD